MLRASLPSLLSLSVALYLLLCAALHHHHPQQQQQGQHGLSGDNPSFHIARTLRQLAGEQVLAVHPVRAERLGRDNFHRISCSFEGEIASTPWVRSVSAELSSLAPGTLGVGTVFFSPIGVDNLAAGEATSSAAHATVFFSRAPAGGRPFVCSVFTLPPVLLLPLFALGLADGFVGQFLVPRQRLEPQAFSLPVGVGSDGIGDVGGDDSSKLSLISDFEGFHYDWFDVLASEGDVGASVLLGVRVLDVQPPRQQQRDSSGNFFSSLSTTAASVASSGPSGVRECDVGCFDAPYELASESWMVESMDPWLQLSCASLLARVYCSRGEAEMARSQCAERVLQGEEGFLEGEKAFVDGRARFLDAVRRRRTDAGKTTGAALTSQDLTALLLLVPVSDFCYPRPADCMQPVLLTCSFYANCIDRWFPCPLEENYAIEFGRRYCRKFRGAVHGLTEPGRRWVKRTMRCLQQSLLPVVLNASAGPDLPQSWDEVDAAAEKFRRLESRSSPTCRDARSLAFDAHPRCYTNQPYSVCELITPSLHDWRKIFSVVEWSEIGEALPHLSEIWTMCSDLLLSS